MVLRILAIACVAYAGVVTFLYLTQTRMIFLPNIPTRSIQFTPDDIDLAHEVVELTTEDGVRITGWFIPAAADDAPVIAFFHGNAGNIGHRLDTIRLFHEIGAATLIINYRGYGDADGKPSESGLYLDAEAAWQWLIDRGFDTHRIVSAGRSLGAGVAAELALRRPVGGLVLESTFSSMVELGREIYPWLPVRWLLHHRFETVDKLADISAPTLVIHSRDDDLVPFHHAERLAAIRPPVVDLVELTGHHNQPIAARPGYREALREFIHEGLRTARP